jgi:hypothetical protein
MNVWNAMKTAVEVFDEALRLREELLRQERFKHLGR